MLAQVLIPPILLPIPGAVIVGGIIMVGIALFQLFGGSKVLAEGIEVAVQWLLDRTVVITKWVFERAVEAWGLVVAPLRDLWAAMWDLSFELARVVRDIVVHRIPQALSWAADELAALGARVSGVALGLFRFIGEIRDSLTGLVTTTRDWLVAVPIAAAMAAVVALEGFVTGVAVPRLWDGIREARDALGRLVKGVRVDLAVLTALVAGGVMTAVRLVNRCSKFLRWLCGRPKDVLHAIMTGNWPILSLPIMLAAIRGMATAGDAVEDELARYLDA